jgi:signal transduction histidine kinase
MDSFERDFEREYKSLKRQIDAAAKTSRAHINRIIGLISMLQEQDSGQASLPHGISSDLNQTLYKLLAHNINLNYCCSEELLPDSPFDAANLRNAAPVIDAGALLAQIVAECGAMLEEHSGRHGLTLRIPGDEAEDEEYGGEYNDDFPQNPEFAVKITEKAFTLAVMNLLQNAFLYSPPNTTVIVSIELESDEDSGDELVCVSVTNLSGSDAELLRGYTMQSGFGATDESAGLGVPLVNKIAACYGGNLKFVSINGRIIAKFSLPLHETSDNRSKLQLQSDFSEYIGEKYGFVRAFMAEVTSASERKHTNTR